MVGVWGGKRAAITAALFFWLASWGFHASLPGESPFPVWLADALYYVPLMLAFGFGILAFVTGKLNELVTVIAANFLGLLLIVSAVQDEARFFEVQMGILASLIIALSSVNAANDRAKIVRTKVKRRARQRLAWAK